MKTIAVDLFPFEIPLVEPFRIATMECRAASGVFVRLKTDEGLVGWGEATPLHSINGETRRTCTAALHELAPLLIGGDPSAIQVHVDRMEYVLPAQHAAASALDMSLHDLAAKAAGVPLWRFLQGTTASLPVARRLPTDLTIGIKSTNQAAAQAAHIVAKGHRVIKIKLGAGIEGDTQRVRVVREAVGDSIALRVDANQGYQRDEALELLRRIAPSCIEFCEQPIHRKDLEGMRFLHASSPVAIMADESVFSPPDAVELIRNSACSLFNVKLSKSRGIRRAMEIASIAQSSGIGCMIGGMVETRLGVTAAAHLGAALDVFKYFDLDAHTAHREDVIVGGIQMDCGDVILPETPGLGAEPDPAFLKTLATICVGPQAAFDESDQSRAR